jgi:hypothetical protein
MSDLFGGTNIVGYDPDDEPGPFGISFTRLKKLFECNPEEGWAKRKVSVANSVELLPHYTSIDSHFIFRHHVIWVFHTDGIWAGLLDHIDGNSQNDKISNLREVTVSQNAMNMKIHENNTSGVTGVSWRSDIQRWQVYIDTQANGKRIYLGYFKDFEFEDAVTARYAAEDEYFGEFAARHSRPPFTYAGSDLFG